MVPLGHQLRADDDVVFAPRDFGEPVANLAHRPHVRGQHHRPRPGESFGNLFGQPLDARTYSNKRIAGAARTAHFGRALFVPAMVTHQDTAEPVFDQPGRAIGALILMPA